MALYRNTCTVQLRITCCCAPRDNNGHERLYSIPTCACLVVPLCKTPQWMPYRSCICHGLALPCRLCCLWKLLSLHKHQQQL